MGLRCFLSLPARHPLRKGHMFVVLGLSNQCHNRKSYFLTFLLLLFLALGHNIGSRQDCGAETKKNVVHKER